MFGLSDGPRVMSNSKKVDLFDIFTGKVKVNEPVSSRQVASARKSPHHQALSHNYNNRSKCFSNEQSRSKERQLLQIEVMNPEPNLSYSKLTACNTLQKKRYQTSYRRPSAKTTANTSLNPTPMRTNALQSPASPPPGLLSPLEKDRNARTFDN